ncbi:hypothetical protein DBR11_28855 [Pedobacter sp. HMWF019]|uniref:tetratricopeptide repeat protein n=1 Tax=Pedobacter sp. HMWF019 TaxID=2056856 RepID=UPI000D3A0D8A|nr:tetratricopeptide repeat protein [Pedobacter sp. HMWF019]PTS91538.1 hypothetical protein DBR11_28855 [Pedobacter sp. HMWF019]
MIDLEYLHSLYNNDNYEACLEAANLFLLVNEQNTQALLLKAKSEYQMVFFEAWDEDPEEDNRFESVCDSFERVLELDPSNEEAMLYLAYIYIALLKTNLPKAIAYCDIMANSTHLATKIKAISYRQDACQQEGHISLALEDADQLISLTKAFYKENRNALDVELGQVYLKKGNLYLQHQNDGKKALEIYKEGLDYMYPDPLNFAMIANLAFDQQDYAFGGQVAVMAFLSNVTGAEEELLDLYRKLEELNSKGVENKSMVEAIFVALRVFADELGCDTVEMLNFAQHYIKIFADWYIPYHYAGAALYDAKSYAEALPYLEKSLKMGGRSYGVQRFYETSYHVNGVFPELEKWPEDSSSDYYNAGVNFYEFETQAYNPSIGRELLKIRTNFYKISYDGFYDYFCNHHHRKGANDADVHVFAMCCNNYGIALTAQGAYEKAAEVHQLGYSFSPFWEQLSSWGTALKRLEKYDEALEVFNRAVTYGSSYLDFSDYIELRGEILEILFKLGRLEETRELLTTTDQEYNDFIRNNRKELSEAYLFTLNERYITVQNIRLDLLKEGSLEEANKAWQEQLEKHPDDNSSWFMLMQNYYQMKDYRQCIACADNYQSVKGKAIQLESVQKVHFMRGMSYLYLGNYNQAKENLKILLQSCQSGDPAEESIISDVNLRLAECCYNQEQWKECMDFAWDGIDCYNRNGWKWDDARVEMTLYYADACKATGELKAAIGSLDTILKMVPGNQEAIRRKKEWKPNRGLFSFFK